MRILLVSSSGGHLVQPTTLRPWWEQHERLWITFDSTDTRSMLAGERVQFGYKPTTRNIPNLFRNTLMARRVMAEFQPNLIISTGAGLAAPYFWLAKRFGSRTVYLEVVDRIDSPTLTGRLVYPFTDDFLVQWNEQLEFYKGATCVGPVI